MAVKENDSNEEPNAGGRLIHIVLPWPYVSLAYAQMDQYS